MRVGCSGLLAIMAKLKSGVAVTPSYSPFAAASDLWRKRN
jgi:hypothetical protein